VLCVQGYSDQAKEQARMSLEEAEAADPGFTLGWVLHHAVCPIGLLTGDLAIADRGVATMKDVATRLDAALWRSSGVTGKARRSSSVPSSYEDPPCCEQYSIHAIKLAGIFAMPSSLAFWRAD